MKDIRLRCASVRVCVLAVCVYVDIVSLRRVDVAVFALAVRVCLASVALQRVALPLCGVVVAVYVEVIALPCINVPGEDEHIPVRFAAVVVLTIKECSIQIFHDLLYNIAVISILQTLLTTEKEL